MKPQQTLAARSASGSDFEVRLAKNLTQAASANASTMWILCPSLDRLSKDTGSG